MHSVLSPGHIHPDEIFPKSQVHCSASWFCCVQSLLDVGRNSTLEVSVPPCSTLDVTLPPRVGLHSTFCPHNCQSSPLCIMECLNPTLCLELGVTPTSGSTVFDFGLQAGQCTGDALYWDYKCWELLLS